MNFCKSAVTLLFILLLNSCERIELPEPIVEGLVFELTGTLGGEPFSIGIDQEGYQMTTAARFHENDSIWEFSGRLEPIDGRIGPSLSLNFRPEFTGRLLIQDEAEIFTQSNWRFFSQEGRKSTLNPFTLNASFDENGISIKRIYVPGSSVNLLKNDDQWQWETEEIESLPICIDYENAEKKSGLLCTHLIPEKDGAMTFVNWGVTNATDSTAVLVAKIQNLSQNQQFKYDWGEGFQENRNYHVKNEGTFELKVMDQNGIVYSHRKSLIRDRETGNFITYANVINLESTWGEPRLVSDYTQRGSIKLNFKDSNGVEWRLSPEQNERATFRILDRKVYKEDREGNSTIALLLELSCLLENTQNEQMEIENLKGWFAIGMPN